MGVAVHWCGHCIGAIAGDAIEIISDLEIAHVNIPVALLVWLMIYPMMVQIDFGSLKEVRQNAKDWD